MRLAVPKEYGLDETNLIRHYDVTGKLCPLYYVQNPEAWDQLKTDVGEALAELKNGNNGFYPV